MRLAHRSRAQTPDKFSLRSRGEDGSDQRYAASGRPPARCDGRGRRHAALRAAHAHALKHDRELSPVALRSLKNSPKRSRLAALSPSDESAAMPPDHADDGLAYIDAMLAQPASGATMPGRATSTVGSRSAGGSSGESASSPRRPPASSAGRRRGVRRPPTQRRARRPRRMPRRPPPRRRARDRRRRRPPRRPRSRCSTDDRRARRDASFQRRRREAAADAVARGEKIAGLAARALAAGVARRFARGLIQAAGLLPAREQEGGAGSLRTRRRQAARAAATVQRRDQRRRRPRRDRRQRGRRAAAELARGAAAGVIALFLFRNLFY